VVEGRLTGARLVAGASTAAKAIIRETDSGGAILAVLSADAALVADDFQPAQGIIYRTALYVTITGTAPQLNLFTE
jgi:hypothetical protein